MTDAAVETSVDLTPDGFDFDLNATTSAYDRVCVEESIYTAELDSMRLLEDIEEHRLNSKTKIVYSNILYELYTHIVDVKAKEPDYGDCIKENLSKPRPMGPYDGLKFFVQSCPVDDKLFLSFLRRKDRKKRKRVGRR